MFGCINASFIRSCLGVLLFLFHPSLTLWS